jgi:hypothetical protein
VGLSEVLRPAGSLQRPAVSYCCMMHTSIPCVQQRCMVSICAAIPGHIWQPYDAKHTLLATCCCTLCEITARLIVTIA